QQAQHGLLHIVHASHAATRDAGAGSITTRLSRPHHRTSAVAINAVLASPEPPNRAVITRVCAWPGTSLNSPPMLVVTLSTIKSSLNPHSVKRAPLHLHWLMQ